MFIPKINDLPIVKSDGLLQNTEQQRGMKVAVQPRARISADAFWSGVEEFKQLLTTDMTWTRCWALNVGNRSCRFLPGWAADCF